MDFESMLDTATTLLTAFGFKILGAIAAWLIGRYLIRLAVRLMTAALGRQRIDPTITRYAGNVVNVGLTVVLILALLGYFGFETTSFAALLAGLGVAIGAAWAGLLANFAAGAFLVVLRPFRVGDYIKVAGVEGTVTEIGLFATTIMLPDHVTAFVGNNKIFADTIQNYSAHEYRRVDRTAQLAHGVDVQDAVKRLKEALAKIPHVQKIPAPEVEIIDFTTRGPLLAVRSYTHTSHYWQVYFDTNRAICDTFGAAGYPVPVEHVQNTAAQPAPAKPAPAQPAPAR
ncbi:MAG: mechanosensitive ion channel family protein [Burkholderiales bacterium]